MLLSVAMSQIRKALEDNARKPLYIKTIPGIDYRLIAEVKEIKEVATPKIKAVEIPKNKPSKIILTLSISFVIIFSAFYFFYVKSTSTSTSTPALTQLPSLSAQSNYQKGRYLLTQKDKKSWQEAKQIFEDTIINSPEFAPVYRELAQAKFNNNDSISFM